MTSLWLDRAQPLLTSGPGDVPADVDVVVAGAGITGLVTAVLLARARRRVAVLEARDVGAVTTGRTTGKVSLLQGTRLSTLARQHDDETLRDHVGRSREGQQWLRHFMGERQVPYQVRHAATFAATPDERDAVVAEHQAGTRAGLTLGWAEQLDVPFPVHGATVLADQLQIDPMPLLAELVEELTHRGGTIHTSVRVMGADTHGYRSGVVVRTDAEQDVYASHLVLATGSPVLDRGLTFAQLQPQRSYSITFDRPGGQAPLPMMLSAGASATTIRDVPWGDDSLLLVGGEGHVVGRGPAEKEHYETLVGWTRQHAPDALATHAWSAQDYATPDGLPMVGTLPWSRGRVLAASGYAKWGLTSGTWAALTIAQKILDGRPVLERRSTTRPATAGTGVNLTRFNSEVAGELVKGAVRKARPGCGPAPLCTHLGGVTRWNDAERSWDCPLHGSRFDTDGSVLEGPATRPATVPAERPRPSR